MFKLPLTVMYNIIRNLWCSVCIYALYSKYLYPLSAAYHRQYDAAGMETEVSHGLLLLSLVLPLMPHFEQRARPILGTTSPPPKWTVLTLLLPETSHAPILIVLCHSL